MVSACFKEAGFSLLYGRDWIGCVPGGTLISKSMRRNPVWTRIYIYIYNIYIYIYNIIYIIYIIYIYYIRVLCKSRA